jgi:CDP-glucose 4,6-dehydratase
MRLSLSHSYANKNVLVTGHTGFKGSWLSLWLKKLGAKVTGVALPPPSDPSHFEIAGLRDQIRSSLMVNLCDRKEISSAVESAEPEIIFHLAAQSLVRPSYVDPHQTWMTNVMGTLNLLDAARNAPSVRAIVVVTSDKCYENKEWHWGYRESDALGGKDPYSSSKAAAEILTSSMRQSFFPLDEFSKKHGCLLATVRAGNVIGGGDFADYRLIPDIVKAVSRGQRVVIRNPSSVRPWQHVLDPLYGYLLLGGKLLDGQKDFSGAWNFGPTLCDSVSVLSIVKIAQSHWECDYVLDQNHDHEMPEAQMLKLDSSKSNTLLKWQPRWNCEQAVARTIRWYQHYYQQGSVLSHRDVEEYEA